MREIISRYPGECRKCQKELSVGDTIAYEKLTGVFCPGCAPTDPEEIRAYRQEGADRKADRLEGWASKRRQKAEELRARNEPYRGDTAFNTQPGRIIERERANARDERAYEHTQKAQAMEARAENIRKVRVKGDAARRDEALRDYVRPRLHPGAKVETAHCGMATVEKVNQKTARVRLDSSGHSIAYDLIFLKPMER